LNTSLTINLNGNSLVLSLSFCQPGNRRTLEGELPVFLNLLSVTTETGLNLPQSIKFLSQSFDTSCSHLVQIFAAILDRANATNMPFSDALKEANQSIKVDFIANLVTALAVPTSTTEELLSVINAQAAIACSRNEKKCFKLRNNYWRRWAPHAVFFSFFVMPMIVTPMLGPALCQPSTLWAIGPNNYGIPF
jgi:hypothetical protein